MKDHHYLQLASRHYLSQELPENWDDLGISDQNQYLYDNAWEPFAGIPADELYEQMEDLAKDFKQVAERERIATLSEIAEKLRDNSKTDA